jgi:hypothetical protein
VTSRRNERKLKGIKELPLNWMIWYEMTGNTKKRKEMVGNDRKGQEMEGFEGKWQRNPKRKVRK